MTAGDPPLLWQMAMLAQAGWTILPRVTDHDPDRSFPELTVAMEEVEWSAEHRCLIGGDRFEVMRVPASYHGHVVKPKIKTMAFSPMDATEPLGPPWEEEHYRQECFAVTVRGKTRFEARFMICQGSRAAERVAEGRCSPS